ncbi:EscU/YscU/HrcU family type III secretion system export apparatus switch protein, partial [Peribacillus sp. NPDC056705]|uniref:EscU/YscU/HrcU family type III secretion system export apparatus switch protein n=1 Tax=Peribacillus sp. NPDC056705 TaxID=3345918 RepID=UPI00374A1188
MTAGQTPDQAMKKVVALKYTPGESEAPIVVAKGQGKLAESILSKAMEHGVPVQ